MATQATIILKKDKNNTESKIVIPDALKETSVKLTVTQGATVNLGDYESARFEYGIEVTSALDKVDKVRKEMDKYIDFLINKRINSIKN